MKENENYGGNNMQRQKNNEKPLLIQRIIQVFRLKCPPALKKIQMLACTGGILVFQK